MKSKPGLLFVCFFFMAAGSLWPQDIEADNLYNRGLAAVKIADYSGASALFRAVLEDARLAARHGDSLVWLAKSELAMNNIEEAALAVDRFMGMGSTHPAYPEAVYLKGRLLFIDGEADKAIVTLKSFLDSWPYHKLASAALYWTGESLTALGYLEEADSAFRQLLERWPGSVKREASRYRRAEIELKHRERELLELLKWSHEEFLEAVEEFYRKEREYEEALAAYQGLGGGSKDSDQFAWDRTQLLENKALVLTVKSWYLDELRKTYGAK